ncbi:hypothetical protein GobsT_28340 [Gemmata obscuriglobus]|nr:hypothetical protein GobsT_28340 [Gemmata obscuriglobus]VTS05654.1 unnamed protein product [Gemmata obscuriglobus UQM 2246]
MGPQEPQAAGISVCDLGNWNPARWIRDEPDPARDGIDLAGCGDQPRLGTAVPVTPFNSFSGPSDTTMFRSIG